MTETNSNRYGVRVGDDGRWYSKWATLGQAREAAKLLSETGWAGKAQIVDFVDGYRETWRDGSR